jgi:hypothetical protein
MLLAGAYGNASVVTLLFSRWTSTYSVYAYLILSAINVAAALFANSIAILWFFYWAVTMKWPVC